MIFEQKIMSALQADFAKLWDQLAAKQGMLARRALNSQRQAIWEAFVDVVGPTYKKAHENGM